MQQFKQHTNKRGQRRGFTLVELVIVVLVMGIIAATAAPKLFDTANDARKSTACQSLSVLRNAIELFRATNGEIPGQTGGGNGFKSDLQPYLTGSFPICPVGNLNDNVIVKASGDPLTAAGNHGWCYNKTTGEFMINHIDYMDL